MELLGRRTYLLIRTSWSGLARGGVWRVLGERVGDDECVRERRERRERERGVIIRECKVVSFCVILCATDAVYVIS
jgi:hypothetical protein